MSELDPKTSSGTTASSDEARPVRNTIEYGRLSPRSALADRVIDSLKTLAWVAPLTLLIWIYAERKQAATRTGVTVPVEVRINSKDRIVVMRNPPDQNFIATLSGPQASLQRVIDAVGAPLPGNHAAVQINIDAKTSGDLTLNAQDALRRSPLFQQAGISIREVIPPTFNVTVMDMEDRVVPVRAPEDLKNLANARFVPSDVSVHAPRAVFEDAVRNNRLYVVAELAKVEAINQPGEHDVPSVAVTPAFAGTYATVEPKTVTASFKVNRADAEATLDYSVPVWPAGPTPFLAKYKVECKTLSIPGVHVVGPQDQVDLLKSHGYPVVTLLYVTPDDLGGGEHRRLLRFDLPPGVRVTNDPEQYTVTFSVIERPQQE